MNGRYVAFEGIEGAGKSTIARCIVSALQEADYPVVFVREPGGTSTGERIREILLDGDAFVTPWAEVLLFAAARAQLVREEVRPALEAGSWVVSDRSVYSSLAYQGIGRELGIDLVRRINDVAIGGLWPHEVVLLRVDVDVGLQRQRVADRIGAEGIEFQQRVSRAFDTLAVSEPARFIVTDAASPVDALIEEIWEQLHRPARPLRM